MPKGWHWLTKPLTQVEMAENLEVIQRIITKNRAKITPNFSRTKLTFWIIRNIGLCNERWKDFPEHLMVQQCQVYKQLYNQVCH